MKPDIVVPGANVTGIHLEEYESIALHHGTSIAAPLASGAAGLILSANPYLASSELKQYIMQAGRNYPDKNDSLGFGLPDFYEAAQSAGAIISPLFIYHSHSASRLFVYADIRTDTRLVAEILNPDFPSSRAVLYEYTLEQAGEKLYLNDIAMPLGSDSLYIRLLLEGEETRTMPFYEDYYVLPAIENKLPYWLNYSKLLFAEGENNLYIFPSVSNKGQNKVNIETMFEDAGDFELAVYALDGRMVNNVSVNDSPFRINHAELDISGLAVGIYVVVALQPGGKTLTGKFAIVR